MRTDEPEQIYCTAGECLEEAIVTGHATIQVNALAAAPDHEVWQTFTLPLCAHHAHLLRYDNHLVDFDNGILDRDQI